MILNEHAHKKAFLCKLSGLHCTVFSIPSGQFIPDKLPIHKCVFILNVCSCEILVFPVLYVLVCAHIPTLFGKAKVYYVNQISFIFIYTKISCIFVQIIWAALHCTVFSIPSSRFIPDNLPNPKCVFILAYLAVPVRFLFSLYGMCWCVRTSRYFLARPKSIM